jgi:hypothetical protein
MIPSPTTTRSVLFVRFLMLHNMRNIGGSPTMTVTIPMIALVDIQQFRENVERTAQYKVEGVECR